MITKPPSQPYLALVDDDTHSARLLSRELLAHGAPTIEWMGGADAAEKELTALLADADTDPPAMVIVDLKTSSCATADFIRRLKQSTPLRNIPVVALAPTLEKKHREDLLSAGAAAVFARHADIVAYREEAANMVSFWARRQGGG